MLNTLIRKAIALLGSFGLAALLLVLLLVLTFAGTLEQGRSTLHHVQTEYFESAFVIHYWGGKYPMPLPGGYLLLPLLFLNLILGGLVRMRRGASTVGVFIVHLGIVLMLVGSFIEDKASTKGVMRVWEPRASKDALDVASEFSSYTDWEVAIVRHDATGTTEFVIPQSEIEGLDADDHLYCENPELPFQLVLSDYMSNSGMRQAESGASGTVNGLVLFAKDPISKQDEGKMGNLAGLRARLVERASGRAHEMLIWAGKSRSFDRKIGDQRWSVTVRKRSWDIPFAIRLDRFVHEYHPGTMMPRRFSSFVTLTEPQADETIEREVHITMNEPLRHEGYTFYQSGWGPQQGQTGRRLFSDFAVVSNPSDDIPLISCIVIFLGLLIHFGQRLLRWQKAESKRRAATGSTS